VRETYDLMFALIKKYLGFEVHELKKMSIFDLFRQYNTVLTIQKESDGK